MDAIKVGAGVDRMLRAAKKELEGFTPSEMQAVFLSVGDTLGRIITAEATNASLQQMLEKVWE